MMMGISSSSISISQPAAAADFVVPMETLGMLGEFKENQELSSVSRRNMPRLGLMAALMWAIRTWQRSRVGSAVARRWEELAAYSRSERIKSRLKSCGVNVSIGWKAKFESPGNIEIGNDVSIVAFVHIWGDGGVSIGDRTMIGSHSAISSVTHDYRQRVMRETVVLKPVSIGGGRLDRLARHHHAGPDHRSGGGGGSRQRSDARRRAWRYRGGRSRSRDRAPPTGSHLLKIGIALLTR
jgi:hypothetical protein